jgi:hypothetical protein
MQSARDEISRHIPAKSTPPLRKPARRLRPCCSDYSSTTASVN